MRFFVLIGAVAASSDIRGMWNDFKKEFNVKYTGAREELERLEIFTENMGKLEAARVMDPSAQYSHLTPFADKTEEEFANLSKLSVTPQVLREHQQNAVKTAVNVRSLPKAFDWRAKGAVTPVKNQGQCGSCWAFATVASVEGSNFLTNGKLLSLSEQELVSCDKTDEGCSGGLPSQAYTWMVKHGEGFETESDYPYSASNAQCKAEKSKEAVFLDKAAGWKQIGTDEDEIAQALIDNGPLAIGINATWMQFYFGGISNPLFCSPKSLDHGVTIVGFGEEAGKKFWIIKNSWGSGWGEKGYYRIIRGTGKCGVNQMVTAAVAQKNAENIFV